jgi:hypothetical protein
LQALACAVHADLTTTTAAAAAVPAPLQPVPPSTGSTDTSLWTHYKAGEREYCGNSFPDGMVKNQRLASNVITPTTKSEDHDEPISPAEIISKGLMSKEDWEAASSAALALFEFGQQEAAKRGLLLVDTKYEFGKTADGRILLIDEVGPRVTLECAQHCQQQSMHRRVSCRPCMWYHACEVGTMPAHSAFAQQHSCTHLAIDILVLTHGWCILVYLDSCDPLACT